MDLGPLRAGAPLLPVVTPTPLHPRQRDEARREADEGGERDPASPEEKPEEKEEERAAAMRRKLVGKRLRPVVVP